MKVIQTDIEDAYLILPEERHDERGHFSRLFCTKTFKEHGLEHDFVQMNHSHSKLKGTLRGLHYQLPPHEEVKLVKCTRGSLFDVIVDIRESSPTFGNIATATLSRDNGAIAYVPKGCAHGIFTLEDDSEILYLVSAAYAPEYEQGIRYDDPLFSIPWPDKPLLLSDKDAAYPLFEERSLVSL